MSERDNKRKVKVVRSWLAGDGRDIGPSTGQGKISIVAIYDQETGNLITESIEAYHRHGA
jgi:hypothetical protein